MSYQLYDRCIAQWGADLQQLMAIEEMAECTVAICNLRRGRGSLDDLAEEVADVEIMMGQLRRMVGEAKVDQIKLRKLFRLEGRLEGRLPVQHG